ncbi:hypothetical protein PM082_018395 [Marasmius tenuissimus]|nr:hypothetical protein PM082_018395 [Marasmius tenuissimus]
MKKMQLSSNDFDSLLKNTPKYLRIKERCYPVQAAIAENLSHEQGSSPGDTLAFSTQEFKNMKSRLQLVIPLTVNGIVAHASSSGSRFRDSTVQNTSSAMLPQMSDRCESYSGGSVAQDGSTEVIATPEVPMCRDSDHSGDRRDYTPEGMIAHAQSVDLPGMLEYPSPEEVKHDDVVSTSLSEGMVAHAQSVELPGMLEYPSPEEVKHGDVVSTSLSEGMVAHAQSVELPGMLEYPSPEEVKHGDVNASPKVKTEGDAVPIKKEIKEECEVESKPLLSANYLSRLLDGYIKRNQDINALLEQGITDFAIRRCVENTTTALRYHRLTVEEALVRYERIAGVMSQMIDDVA